MNPQLGDYMGPAEPGLGVVTGLAWTQLWQVTLAAVAVAVVVWLFCRKRPHLAYLLWMLVVVKCLTPPLWTSPTGLFSWAMVRVIDPAPQGTWEDTVAAPPEEVAVVSEPPTEAEPMAVSKPLASDHTPSRRPLKPATVLGIVWLSGVVIYTGWVIGLRVAWSLMLRRATVAPDDRLARLVTNLSGKLGIRRRVRVLVTEEPVGPVVFGVLRPTLLLPAALWSEQSKEHVETILAHELVHVRRVDTTLCVLQMTAQAIWWFHPFVWCTNRAICRQRERCCDEGVVAGLGCDPARYAQALLDVLKLKHKLRPVFTFPGVRPVEVNEQRMEDIMEPNRKFHRYTPRWCWAVALMAGVLILPGGQLVIGGDAPESDRVEPAPAELLQTFQKSDTSDGDSFGFGHYVAALGENALVSAIRDDVRGENTGVVHMFDSSSGKLLHIFQNPTPGGGALFGTCVAALGGKLCVGVPWGHPEAGDAGRAYLIDGQTGELLRTFKNPKPEASRWFGWSVAALGHNVIVGAPGNDMLAAALRNNVIVGAPGNDMLQDSAGTAYLVDAATGKLIQTFRSPTPAGGDGFGFSVAALGENVLVGAPLDDTTGKNTGAVYLFDGKSGKVLQTFNNPKPVVDEWFGNEIAAFHGNVLVCALAYWSETGAKAAYLFDSSTGKLLRTFPNPRPCPGDRFGRSVAVSGQYILIGAPGDDQDAKGSGAAYLFDGFTGKLVQTFRNPTPAVHDRFGASVAMLGNRPLISAKADDTGGENAGAVYLFESIGQAAADKTP